MGLGVMEAPRLYDCPCIDHLPQRTGMIYKNADIDGIIMILDQVQAREHPGASAA